MIRVIVISIFLFSSLFSKVFGQENKTLTKIQMQQDITALVGKIKYTHPNPYYYRSKSDWKIYLDSVQGNLPETLSEFDFWRKIDQILIFMNDAHTRSYPTKFYKEYVKNDGLFFPFSIENREGNYFVAKNSSGTTIDTNEKIIAINGIPIQEIIAKLKLHSSKELDYLDEKYVTSSFGYYLWWAYDLKSPYKIDFSDENNKTRTIEINGILEKDFPKENEEKNEEICTLSIEKDSVALLTIKDFDSEKRSYFKKFYRKSFKKINKLKIKNIVIDVRNHNGGDSRYGEDFAKYFADKPFRISSKTIWKVTPEFKNGFAQMYVPKVMRWAKFLYGINKHTKAIWHTKDNELAVVNNKLIKPKRSALKYKRNIYVLTDNYTFSAGSMFAGMVKDYQLGTIVGQPTGNLSSFYADPFLWYQLPNSKITFQVSTSLEVRPNGIIDTESILPDIYINDKEDALEKTFELIQAKNHLPK